MWCHMALSDWLARHRAVVWLAAVFLGPVVAGLLTLARPQLHENHVTLLLVLAVAMVSAAGVRPAGLVGAVTTGLAYDYFWTEPYYSFRILDTQDILTVILLVLGGRCCRAAQLVGWPSARHGCSPARLLDRPEARRRANCAGNACSSASGRLGHSRHRAGRGQLSPSAG